MTFFPSDWGMLRRSRCVQIFLPLSPFAAENLISRDRFGRAVALCGFDLIYDTVQGKEYISDGKKR